MLITNFSAGELSAMLNGRTDLQQYYQGAGKIRNFDVIPTGGIRRRVGTERIGTLTKECLLIPMILDSSTCFVLEAEPNDTIDASAEYNSTIRIWKDGSVIQTVPAPWQNIAEIKEVQYAQNYNEMMFVQRDRKPFYLIYNTGTSSFTYGLMTFDFTPDIQLDDDYSKVYRHDGTSLPTTNVFDGKTYQWLIFEGYLYVWDGTKWALDTGTQEYTQDTGLFTEEGKRPGCVAFFNGRLYFASTKEAQQKVWASAAPDVEGNRYNVFSTYTKYITVNRAVKDPDMHYFTGTCTEGTSVINGVSEDLSGIPNISDYYVTSDAFPTGTKVVSATSDSLTVSLNATAGFTGVMSIQLWKNSTSASADDYEYKVVNSNLTAADDSFYFEIASDQNDAIKWLASSRYLVIGSESANYVMPSSVTAQNIVAEMDGRYGTDSLQATTVQTATLFFGQGKKVIREYYYSSDTEAFVSNDIAMWDSEVLDSAACDFDFMATPYSRVLVTREDGTMAVLLYEKSAGVMAWSNLELGDGQIESVAVTRGKSGSDYVYLAVNHSGTRYLERIDMEKETYLDSWRKYSSGITGYDGTATVYNATTGKHTTLAEITEDFVGTGDTAYIGYAYSSLIRSMPLVTQDYTGKKRITALLVRFFESYRPDLKVDGKQDEVFADFTEPYSGIKKITYPGDSERDVTFTLEISKPEPCTILAVDAQLA